MFGCLNRERERYVCSSTSDTMGTKRASDLLFDLRSIFHLTVTHRWIHPSSFYLVAKAACPLWLLHHRCTYDDGDEADEGAGASH